MKWLSNDSASWRSFGGHFFVNKNTAMPSGVLHSPTDIEVYHVGASLKDLGKKWFAFSTLNFPKEEIVGKLE